MNYFTAEKIQILRREITEQGIAVDPFLGPEPDCPIFGLNLACCWPFPAELQTAYNQLAEKLTQLDPGVYVYPFWETHITLVTFVNFAVHQKPSAPQRAEIEALIPQILECLKPTLSGKPFALEFQPPVLTRKAAILPIANPDGQITAIRQSVFETLQNNPKLHERLTQAGLNIPGIIHSTILRFKSAPANLPAFLDGFAAISAETKIGGVTCLKLLLTSETKPYMRAGSIIHSWSLG